MRVFVDLRPQPSEGFRRFEFLGVGFEFATVHLS